MHLFRLVLQGSNLKNLTHYVLRSYKLYAYIYAYFACLTYKFNII